MPRLGAVLTANDLYKNFESHVLDYWRLKYFNDIHSTFLSNHRYAHNYEGSFSLGATRA